MANIVRVPHRPGKELVLWAPSDLGAVDDIKKHNGEVVRISKMKTLAKGTYYECENVVSVYGIPFAISPEWLFPIGTPNIPLRDTSF